MATIQHTLDLTTEECPTCGIVFGVTVEYQKRRIQYADKFYCPNGHQQSYAKSEAQRLREEIVAKDKKLSDTHLQALEAKSRVEILLREKERLEKRLKKGKKKKHAA